jgi:parvulin-like peptidyl-prolyl isomerase
MRSTLLALVSVVAIVAAGCQRAEKKDDKNGSASGTGGSTAGGPVADLDSKEILGRTETTAEVDVKHVLIGWSDLAEVYGNHMDPRAAKRNNAEAAKLAKEILGKLQKDPKQIDDLVKQYSEDPGSLSGQPYTVRADAPFVPEFKNLALRLKVNEAGIVKTRFGYHVMVRPAPPPPDPLASNEILARPPGTETVQVQHVLIGWKGVPMARPNQDPRAAGRDKAAADTLAKQVFDRAVAGEDMAKLMKEFSEDPGSKDNGRVYDVSPDTPMVPPFKDLSLRLKMGEVGMVVSGFGWHVIKRVPPPPPPPPDSLDSVEILKREPVTQKSKVKHILLGWTEVNAGDERGKKRTRAQLETLVKKTMARLKKGEKIEPLMKELSEDPGSAASGEGYDVTPDAGLVQPFKDLGLRLNVGEVGAVKTQFGIHIIQRVE